MENMQMQNSILEDGQIYLRMKLKKCPNQNSILLIQMILVKNTAPTLSACMKCFSALLK